MVHKIGGPEQPESRTRHLLISLVIALAIFAVGSSCIFGAVRWTYTLQGRLYPESATTLRQFHLAESAFVNRDRLTPEVDAAWLEAHAPSLDSRGKACPITLEWVEFTPERKRGLLIADYSCIKSETPRVFHSAFELRTPTDTEATGFYSSTDDPSDPDWWAKPIKDRIGVKRLHITTPRD